MTDNQDSLMREVQQELEREKYQQLWEQYGTYIIAGVAAIILGVAGYQYWQHASRTAVESAGAEYEAALRLIDTDKPSADAISKARTEFEALAQSGPGGYQTLGQLQVAGTHLAAGDKAAALGVYDQVSKRSDVDPILRDFAALQAASIRAGDADWTEMENRLNALTGETGPWRHSALQLLGVVAFQAGKIDAARSAFETLMADQKVPASIRERASLYMARIVALDLAKDGGGAASGGTEAKSETSEAGPSDGASGNGAGTDTQTSGDRAPGGTTSDP